MISSLHRRHRAIEFKKFLQKIDSQVPAELDVHLIDNYGTHKSPAIKRWLARTRAFTCTPPRPAQLDQPGRALVRLPHRGAAAPLSHRSVQALENDIRQWVQAYNENPKPFVWTKTAEQILESLSRLLQRITGGGH